MSPSDEATLPLLFTNKRALGVDYLTIHVVPLQ